MMCGGGHLGEAKLMHRVQERYYWPGYSESESLVQDMCQMRQEKVSYPSEEGFNANNTSRVSYASGGSGHNGPSTRDR